MSRRNDFAPTPEQWGGMSAEGRREWMADNIGLRRTHEDKRRAVRSMLERHPDWSDRRIAEHVGVDHKTVGSVRAETSAEVPQMRVERTPRANPTPMAQLRAELEAARARIAELELELEAARSVVSDLAVFEARSDDLTAALGARPVGRWNPENDQLPPAPKGRRRSR